MCIFVICIYLRFSLYANTTLYTISGLQQQQQQQWLIAHMSASIFTIRRQTHTDLYILKYDQTKRYAYVWLSLSCYFSKATCNAALANEQRIMQRAKVIWTFVVYLIWCETRSANYIWFDKLRCIWHFPHNAAYTTCFLTSLMVVVIAVVANSCTSFGCVGSNGRRSF